METPVGKCKSDRTRTYLPRLFVMRMTDQVIFPEIRSGLHQKRPDIPATVWYDTDIEFSTVQMPELLIYHFFLFFGIRCNVDIRILRHRLCVLIAFLHQFRKIDMDNERDPQLSCFFLPVARLPGENIVCTDIFLNVRNVSNTQHMLPEQIHIKTVLSLQAFYQCPSFFPAAFKQCIRIIAHHSIHRKKRTSFLFDHRYRLCQDRLIGNVEILFCVKIDIPFKSEIGKLSGKTTVVSFVFPVILKLSAHDQFLTENKEIIIQIFREIPVSIFAFPGTFPQKRF